MGMISAIPLRSGAHPMGWTLLLAALLVCFAHSQDEHPGPRGTSLDVDLYGTIYLLDAPSATLRVYDQEMRLVNSTGGPGWENGRFDLPSSVWARNGLDIFVADYGNHRIQRFDRQLAFVSSLYRRDDPDPDQRFGYPKDVALSRLGDLYICDGENQRVLKVNGLSQVTKVFGGFDAGLGKLENPSRLALGPADRVYVLDGSRIVVFDAFGNFLHELYPKMWKEPSALYADGDRIVVADGMSLVCFDRDEHPTCVADLDSVAPGVEGSVRGIGLYKKKMFLLGGVGLVVIDDPCEIPLRIDKE
jgi:hypothetical protein